MQTIWRGNANAWECDELGHLNVRFYLAKAAEAFGGFAQALGMPEAFRARASATLVPRTLTVRFLAEVLPGAPILIRGGVLSHDDTGLTAALIMENAALDECVAAFEVRLDHVDPREGEAFAWPNRMRAPLQELQINPPAEITTRSLSDHDPEPAPSIAKAHLYELEEVGRGLINADEVDVFNRMRLEFAFGKISNSVVHLHAAFPEQWDDFRAGRQPDAASAVLEARLNFHRFPFAGDGYVVRSGLAQANEKIRKVIHWVCDPVSGKALWTMEAVACLLDLKTRKLRRADEAALAAMTAARIDGLRA